MKRAPMVEKMRKRLKANSKINLIDMDLPRTNGHPTPRLKDVLEESVDEKFYLKNEVVEKIVKESKFQERLVSMKVEKPQRESDT